MDLSIRDWMLVIGVLLILAVLLDGYRRVRKAHASRIRMSLKAVPAGSEEELTRGELPNGGARVASRGLDRSTHTTKEPTFGDELNIATAAYAADVLDKPEADAYIEHAPVAEVAVAPVTRAEPKPAAPQARVVIDDYELHDEPEAPISAVRESERKVQHVEEQGAASRNSSEGMREIIVVNAISKDPQGFDGEALLHILLTCDLRFGKMNIFHRYEKSNAKGAVQFSVANAVEPGTFDLNNMRSFKTPGICLFMQLPGPQDAQKALEYMVETAQCIARNLNGELRDENRSALTAQTVEHYRSRIREFDRKRMAKHA